MTKLALITGASSGIGKALAHYHAKQGGDLVIVAHEHDALETVKREIENEYGVKVHAITCDLSQMGGAQKVFDDVQKHNLQVDYLINNAGTGGHGTILERNLQDDINMIVLNVITYVTLTHLFAKQMADRRGGKILNVGSVAGFAPGPKQAVYHASKAFINSFSQAVDQELRNKGVTSTVICPGLVDTNMPERSNLDGTILVSKTAAASAQSVAKIGYNAMLSEKLLVINEYRLSLLMNWILPFLPRRMVMAVLDFMHNK
jgi:short-subunit dehydrogenase